MDRRSFLARVAAFLLAACRRSTEPGPEPIMASYVVANRSCYGGNTPSDGILTGTTFRSRHVADRDITALQLTYFNAAGSSDAGLNAVNYKAGIEYPIGSVKPILFAGVRTASVASGAQVVSDSLNIVIPRGSVFYVRTFVSVTGGNKWVATGITNNSTWGEGLTASVDTVDAGGAMVTTGDGNYLIAPIVIMSTSIDTPSVIIYGDSIAAGSGEGPPFIGNRGYLMRGLNRGLDSGSIPFANVAYPGESIQGFVGGGAGALRKALPSSVTFRDAIVAYGTNDIVAGRTALQIEADLTTLYTLLAGYGCRVWGVTLLPRTTSTDGWATTGNQTPVAGFAVGGIRQVVNTWLRTIPAPLTGVIDASDIVETFRNSSFWKFSPVWTADGTHPNSLAHAAMAAVIPDSRFGIASLSAQVVG